MLINTSHSNEEGADSKSAREVKFSSTSVLSTHFKVGAWVVRVLQIAAMIVEIEDCEMRKGDKDRFASDSAYEA